MSFLSKWSKYVTLAVRLTAVLVLVSALVGCGAASSSKTALVEGKINVVTSFYPLYDFTRHIGGDYVNVINLVPAGVEPHDWSPKSRDMKHMTNAEMFVYQGAGFEGWVHDFLDSMDKGSSLKIVEASLETNLISTAEEEEEEGHEHEEAEAHDDGHGHDLQYDPHVWLSPANAQKMAENITSALSEIDPAHKDQYEANYESYAAQLTDLDQRFKTELSRTSKKEIAVSHQAFAYLCREYGLTQMPIMGLSPDSEPTAQDLKKMNQFIREHDVKYIFFEELVSDKLAKTLAKDAGVDTLVLNPLEGLTEEQAAAGEDYISIMDKNLKNLVKALQ